MKITIVTLHRADSAETYVGAVVGVLTDEEKRAMTDAFAVFTAEGDDEDNIDENDEIGFAEVDLMDSASMLKTLANAYPD